MTATPRREKKKVTSVPSFDKETLLHELQVIRKDVNEDNRFSAPWGYFSSSSSREKAARGLWTLLAYAGIFAHKPRGEDHIITGFEYPYLKGIRIELVEGYSAIIHDFDCTLPRQYELFRGRAEQYDLLDFLYHKLLDGEKRAVEKAKAFNRRLKVRQQKQDAVRKRELPSDTDRVPSTAARHPRVLALRAGVTRPSSSRPRR